MTRCRDFYLKWKKEHNFCESPYTCGIDEHIRYMDSFFTEWLETPSSFKRYAMAERAVRLLLPIQFMPFHDQILAEIRLIQNSTLDKIVKKSSEEYFTNKRIKDLIKKHIPRPELPPLPEGQYNIIVIDPPWPLGDIEYEHRARTPIHKKSIETGVHNRAIERPYHGMSIEEIKGIDLPAAEDCILWLWITNYNLQRGFEVLESWGFDYRACLTWAKPTIGLGYWLRGQTEHCFLATRGAPDWTNVKESTLLRANRNEDSRKPDAFYHMVDRICKGKKIDMFSREKREGWAQWGDEVDKF